MRLHNELDDEVNAGPADAGVAAASEAPKENQFFNFERDQLHTMHDHCLFV
jgi:hypothetical protein